MSRFSAGDRVRIRAEQTLSHSRVPAYARGLTGVIERAPSPAARSAGASSRLRPGPYRRDRASTIARRAPSPITCITASYTRPGGVAALRPAAGRAPSRAR